jgi:pyruvate dehydrogenase E2 component (dihydrolipoamide acetyltransferase)
VVNQPIALFTAALNERLEGPLETSVQNDSSVLGTTQRLRASPLAKKLAKEKGINLADISGTGPRGRIVAKDVEMPVVASVEVALTPMRKVIAQRLVEAKRSIPHFYITQIVDIEPLVNFRQQMEALHCKVSINDCLIKACALALREHPMVNSGFDAQAQVMLPHSSVDISVAVSLESGLITPIVKQADRKSLQEISQEVKALAAKAKSGKLALHEFQGGSFTLSNLGMLGITEFKAIINLPQAAILAAGGIQEVPVIKEGQVVAGKVMHLTLSADHRIIDGVEGAKFMKSIQKKLENPISLVML